MPGTNPHERAKDGDRERVVKQLDAAYAAGRLTAADRDVRVRNARNSATHGELSMLTRDLQAPDAPREFFPPRPQVPGQAPSQPQPPPQAGFGPPAQRQPQQQATTLTATGAGSGSGGAGKVATAVIAFIALLVMGVGVAVFMLVGSVGDSIDDWSDGISDPFIEDAIGGDTMPSPSTDQGSLDEGSGSGGSGAGGDSAAGRYALDQPGLSGFVKAYRKEFGTTRVLGATLQQDQAVFEVPVKGKARHQSWYYRGGEFTSLGDVRANMPGAREVDLADVRIGKLVENLKVARRTLNVEKPDTMYVIVRHHSLQEAPELGIYLTNKFRESGYLATTLGGKVIRTHPHQTR